MGQDGFNKFLTISTRGRPQWERKATDRVGPTRYQIGMA